MNEAEILEQMAVRSSWDAWLELHGVIKDVSGSYIGAGHRKPIVANYLQQRIADCVQWLQDNRQPVRLLILKPRQRGCSTFSVAGLYNEAMKKPIRAAIIGAKEDQAKNLFEILRTYANNDKFDWGADIRVNAEDANISHGDGQTGHVGLLSAKEYDPGRSGTYQFVLATETARWAERGVANAGDVLSGLLKCVQLVDGTTVMLETTASGASGDFYERWTKDAVEIEEYQRLHRSGQSVAGKFVRIFAPWYKFPDLSLPLTPQQTDECRLSLGTVGRYASPEFGDEKQIMQMFGLSYGQVAWRRYAIDTECKRDPRVFEQDYPSTWQTAFLTSGSRRFNVQGLKHFEHNVKTNGGQWGTVEYQGDDAVVWRTCSEFEATCRRWEQPKSQCRYLIAVDPATGSSQTSGKDPDCHAVLVMRQGRYEVNAGWLPPAVVARIVTPCRWDIDVLADYVIRLHKYYGKAMVVVEVNMDRGLIELLKEKGINLYRREVFNQRDSKRTEQLGWQTNVATREMAIENLAKAIREYDTEGQGIELFCPNIIQQLNNFITSERGKSEASEGNHDDDVLALAIGLYCIDGATRMSTEVVKRHLPRDLQKLEATMKRGAGKSQYS